MSEVKIVIRNGCVIDGTGAPRFRADVAIRDDRIAVVGRVDGASRAREIDATGRVVAPGFIDAHTHDDCALLSMPEMTPKVSQGVTSVVAGNCGVSLAPLVLADL
ncbi:MAG: amidohydrolase family protein, partial [Alphaproteobacteria bacterium]|nr:amidohydrolase family protein [Alphaproteobacteria bacterium]